MAKRPPVVGVTGASAGVGRAVVRRFAKDKASIGLIARGHDGLAGAAREVEKLGGRFDAEAREHSPQLWATTHRGWLTGAGVALAGLAGIAISRRIARV